jgi:hypothetical protein
MGHIKKSDLIEKVKRRLGYPVVKVELDDQQIIDNIDYTRDKYIKWATGNITQEFYFTLMLSGGVTQYDLNVVDPGIMDVIGYSTETAGSIHTLFTMENYLYNSGMYDQMLMRAGGDGYTMISYHIARGFMETVKRYIVDAYTFVYHRYDNMLEISPAPPTGGRLVSNDYIYDSPGFILVRAYRIEGDDGDIYKNPWFMDYVTAMCKITLGRIRSKFANFQAVGSNISLAMDGDSLISEGKEEIADLEERLRTEEVEDGGYIIVG